MIMNWILSVVDWREFSKHKHTYIHIHRFSFMYAYILPYMYTIVYVCVYVCGVVKCFLPEYTPNILTLRCCCGNLIQLSA